MVRSQLTLAALATSAVSQLNISQVRSYTYDGTDEYDSALLRTAEGAEYIIRIPNTVSAETEQAADLLGLAALTSGIRNSLPFRIVEPVGQTRAGNTRAVVYTFLPGAKVTEAQILPETTLVPSIATTVAAIHRLPSHCVSSAGLPVRTAAQVHEEVLRLVDRVDHTGLAPATVVARWREVLATTALWQFRCSVINGSFSAQSLLLDSRSEISGVLNWSGLSVSDPAVDFAWLCSAPAGALEQVVLGYTRLLGMAQAEMLIRRARFYSELEVARWLLHGTDTHDQSIIRDALDMFDSLASAPSPAGDTAAGSQSLELTQVEELLTQIPSQARRLSQSAQNGILGDEAFPDTPISDSVLSFDSNSGPSGPLSELDEGETHSAADANETGPISTIRS